MKRATFISATASILLSFWYLTAIVGLDIHVNHHDGEVFVVSMLGHTDCESLHPDDKCHCLEHHHGHCHADDEDCENHVSFLSVTGDGFHFTFDFAPSTYVQAILGAPVQVPVATDHPYPSSTAFYAPPRAYLNSLCVLRV